MVFLQNMTTCATCKSMTTNSTSPPPPLDDDEQYFRLP